jgi:heme A synthase
VSATAPTRSAAYFAWAFVAYLIAVITFGAWVRITGSGAGCGQHWPTCHGEIVPVGASLETMIEYTHRLTSGLCGVFGLGLVLVAWRRFDRRVLLGSIATLVFIGIEGAIGAGLVLQELVADDRSAARAVVIALHLTNTLALVASASLTAVCVRERRAFSWSALGRWSGLMGLALGLMVLTSMAGAVTALGDTLFPVVPTADGGLWAHVIEDLDPTSHFLVRMRAIHPLIALITAGVLLWLAREINEETVDGQDRWPGAAKAARWLIALVCAEVLIGISNVALAAPGAVQLLHLVVAQATWIALVLVVFFRGLDLDAR